MSRERESNWMDLPSDLIHVISQKLFDLGDFIRCRAVCKHWFSSTILSSSPEQPVPWLLEFGKEFPYATPLQEELRYYSFLSGKTGSIPIPDSHRGKFYQRSGHSYLLIIDGEHNISLFNPLTNKVISLPQPPCRFRFIMPAFGGVDLSHQRQWQLSIYNRQTAVQVVASIHQDNMIWKYMSDTSRTTSYYWSGMLFITENRSRTYVLNEAATKCLYLVMPPKDEHHRPMHAYIVESCGVIFRVAWNPERPYKDGETSSIRVYELKFDTSAKQAFWVEVRDIGNCIVFLDDNNAFSMRAPAGLKGNCIYLLSECAPPSWATRTGSNLWSYDIGAGTIKNIPCPFERCTWFVPNMC